MSNTKSSAPSKIYIARLLGLDVFDPFGDRLGRLRDVVVLKRGFGAAMAAGSRPTKGNEPVVVGIIIEVLGKKRVFMPMTRVRSIEASQIISTGLVNLRRFEQRNSEVLVVGELFDRRVRLLDGSGDAVIEDVAIEQRRNGDWGITELFVSRTVKSSSGWRRGHSRGWRRTWSPPAAQGRWKGSSRPSPDAIHEMSDKRMLEIAHELQDERLADVLQELPEEDQVQILSHLDDERAAQVLEEMEPDDAADLLIELPDAQREKLLELMEPDEAEDVRRLLEYDEGTAGSLMNPVPIILSPESTVAEALAHIRAEEIPPAMAAAVLVARPPLETPTGRYLGMVHMQQLLRVPPSESIGRILDTDTEPVSDQASLEELARVLATYDLTIIPIVNESHRLVGAVTIDDVLDALLPEDWRTFDDGTPVRKVGRRFV